MNLFQPQQVTTNVETALPGLAGTYKAQVPVKVTNMQLVSGPYIGANWSGTLQFNEELAAQSEVQRGMVNNRTINLSSTCFF